MSKIPNIGFLLKSRDRKCSIGVLVFAGLVIYGSLGLPLGSFNEPDMGLFPLLLGCSAGLLGILLFLESGPKKETQTPVAFFTKDMKYPAFVTISIIIYPALLEILGLKICILLLLLFLLRLMEPIPWLKVFLIIVSTEVAIILLYSYLIKISIPMGVFGL